MSSQEAFKQVRRTANAERRHAPRNRGELLLYRPRSAPSELQAAARELTIVIRHGGREFEATREMAECFLAKARRVVDAHDSELVALLHRDGLDLLFIADHIPFTVGTVFKHPATAGF